MNRSTTDYWRKWFDDCARTASSDYALNRGTTLRLDELEMRSQRQFLKAVDPSPSDVILDAGCGSGRNLSLLSSRVKEIVGVDFSEVMLARARERVQREALTNVKLGEGSVTSLEFAENHFDKVICASVLQYLDAKDCALALKEMIRVCKPNGKLVLHIKNGSSLYALSLKVAKVILRVLGRQPKPEYYRSRRWHTSTLKRYGATMTDYDSFGIFTAVPMPPSLVRRILMLEMRRIKGKFLKRYGVNFQMTVCLDKKAPTLPGVARESETHRG